MEDNISIGSGTKMWTFFFARGCIIVTTHGNKNAWVHVTSPLFPCRRAYVTGSVNTEPEPQCYRGYTVQRVHPHHGHDSTSKPRCRHDSFPDENWASLGSFPDENWASPRSFPDENWAVLETSASVMSASIPPGLGHPAPPAKATIRWTRTPFGG